MGNFATRKIRKWLSRSKVKVSVPMSPKFIPLLRFTTTYSQQVTCTLVSDQQSVTFCADRHTDTRDD